MDKKRQATPSYKGYILQGYFGVYFFFKNKNYKEIEWIKIESSKEDIEINYYDKSKDFIQVKTHEYPSKNITFDSKQFKKGVITLYEAFNNTTDVKVNKLILANNMFNQGIERLNNKISNGTEENFIYNINNYFTVKEIEEFEKRINNEIKDILYLSRVDETYLLKTGNKILPELRKVINELELQNMEENINESLKILFDENGCYRSKTIDKKEVAWAFIKHNVNQDKVYSKFNKDFENEMAEEGIVGIEMLVGEPDISNMIKNYSSNYEIYSFFQKKIEEYYIRNSTKIIITNFKKLMVEIAMELFDRKELCISDSYPEELKKFIYYFFTYFLYFNNSNIKKIYDEFNIKEVDNETSDFNN